MSHNDLCHVGAEVACALWEKIAIAFLFEASWRHRPNGKTSRQKFSNGNAVWEIAHNLADVSAILEPPFCVPSLLLTIARLASDWRGKPNQALQG